MVVEDLEADQDLQDAVLTVYHMLAITFQHGPATKAIVSHTKRAFIKNMNVAPPPTG